MLFRQLKRLPRLMIVLGINWIVLPIYANDSVNPDDSFALSAISREINVEFKIAPVTCLVVNHGDTCQLDVHFFWQLNRVEDVCLWQENTKIYCWQQAQSANKQLLIELIKTTEFKIKDGQNNLLAKQAIQIKSQQPQHFRRRLHAEWSLF